LQRLRQKENSWQQQGRRQVLPLCAEARSVLEACKTKFLVPKIRNS
jgi:hypothetical protein